MKAYNVTGSGSGKPQTGSTRTQHIDSGVQSSCKQLTEESLSQQLQSSHAPAPPKKKKKSGSFAFRGLPYHETVRYTNTDIQPSINDPQTEQVRHDRAWLVYLEARPSFSSIMSPDSPPISHWTRPDLPKDLLCAMKRAGSPKYLGGWAALGHGNAE